ncbi:MAG: PAS domain-containing protein [Limisphaerales bacterium]
MWVFDLETLAFLEVNESAIQHYGYSREEFLAMTIRDIRPPEKPWHKKTRGAGHGRSGPRMAASAQERKFY